MMCMKEKNDILRSELFAGRSVFDWIFLVFGVFVQIIVFVIQPENPIAVVSGIAGIISVILCAQGKITTFIFGFLQILTYMYLCVVERLYGEVVINIFYFCSQIVAIFVWRKNYHITTSDSAELRPRSLSVTWLLLIVLLSVVLSVITGWFLSVYTNDSQPWLDAFTTIPAIFAQLLLMLAYREQWLLWLIVDILSAVMWLNASNWCLFAQYVFWCTNCLYGYLRWGRQLNATNV